METTDREHERIRWRSRRGLLEMDLVLQRFLERHLASLGESELKAYDALLQLPDNDLLDLVMGRREPDEGGQKRLLEKIRQS
jgi:antitoxin CptB